MRRLSLAFLLALPIPACADSPRPANDVNQDALAHPPVAGEGGYFCCNAAGECFFTPDGECDPGDKLKWCKKMEPDEAGLNDCVEWG